MDAFIGFNIYLELCKKAFETVFILFETHLVLALPNPMTWNSEMLAPDYHHVNRNRRTKKARAIGDAGHLPSARGLGRARRAHLIDAPACVFHNPQKRNL